MRKSFAFLLALILLLSLSLLTAAPACAAITPRYPEKVQQICDSAAVLSPDTVSDIRTLNERLDNADADVTVYRTDLNGTIVCRSDGVNLTFTTEKEG